MSNLLKSVIASSQQKKSIFEKLGAVFAIDAKYSKPGEQWALNKGTAGQVLRARYGSVGRAEIRRGVGLITPGTTVNYAGIPSPSILSGATEIDVRIAIQQRGTAGFLIGHGVGTSVTGLSFAVYISGNTVSFRANNGTVAILATNGVVLDSYVGTDGTLLIRVTWRGSDGRCQLFSRQSSLSSAPSDIASNTGWTQVGSNFTSSTGTLYYDVWDLSFGSLTNASLPFDGIVLASQVATSIGGTPFVQVDFTNQPDLTTSFTCTTGQTVTVTAVNAADTNDPLLLTWSGNNYTYFPGSAAGNDIIVSHTATLSSLSTLEYKVKVRFDALGTTQYLMGSDSTHFQFWKDSSDRIKIRVLRTGDYFEIGAYTSGAIPSLAAGEDIWLRGKLNIATAQCDYWYSRDTTNDPNAVTWTSLTGGVGTYAGSTPALTVSAYTMFGAVSTGIAGMSGRMYVGVVIVDGVTRCHLDMSGSAPAIAGGFETNTPLIRRSASGRKTAFVTRPIWLFGTDDGFVVLDNNLLDFTNTDAFSVVAIFRRHGTPTQLEGMVSKTQGLSGGLYPGYYLGTIQPSFNDLRFRIKDGAVTDYTTQSTIFNSGDLVAAVGVATTSAIQSYKNNTASTSVSKTITTSIANSQNLVIGAVDNGFGNNFDGEIQAVAIFRKALSAAEVAQIVSAYRTS